MSVAIKILSLRTTCTLSSYLLVSSVQIVSFLIKMAAGYRIYQVISGVLRQVKSLEESLLIPSTIPSLHP